MNRLELVEKIAATHELSKVEAARILTTVTSSIVETVAQGDDVQILGFGTFKRISRAARTGFNPQAGKAMQLPAKDVPKFVPGAAFRNTVNPQKVARSTGKTAAAKKAASKNAGTKSVATKKTVKKK